MPEPGEIDTGALDGPTDEMVVEVRPDQPVRCERISGAAGTGKSYTVLQRIGADPEWALLTASTGISAVNLGAVTINSQLRYFDTASMRDAFLTGALARRLHEIGLGVRNILLEEHSMYEAAQLDLLYRGVQEANRYRDMEDRPLGIVIVGDLAQLPPVKGRWCFEATCWGEFAAHTTRLDRVWRQDGGPFLDALNLMRAGKGGAAAETLTSAGATWHTQLDSEFDGTTIVDMNDKVRKFNTLALDRVRGASFTLTSRRWGQQRSEWGENARTHEWGIPPRAEFKEGAYVMVLTNAPDLSYCNGDCGHVTGRVGGRVQIELVRTGAVVDIGPIVRAVEFGERPDGWSGETVHKLDDVGGYRAASHYRGRARRYVVGQIEYTPVRLAYATTIHKSQSLTLDKVQLDFRGWMCGKASMMYVACSRARTLAGLRLVGNRETFAKQVATDPRVTPWL